MDVPTAIKAIESLVSPNQVESKPINEIFSEKCQLDDSTLPERLPDVSEFINFAPPFTEEDNWWRFHEILLDKLFLLKDLLSVADDVGKLLSVSQQKTVKSALELVSVFGIVNLLPKGVGIPLKQRSTLGSGVLPTPSNTQKCYSLCVTVRSLMSLREDDTFKVFISKHHVGDLLSAFFTIIFPPPDLEITTEFKSYAKKCLELLVEKEFQPTVIKELMLLHGNPHTPPRLQRAFRGMLTDRLMQRVGVVATIKAILDLTQGLSSPQHWKTVHTLSRLIVTPHIKDVDAYRTKVYPQIMQLVYANEIEFMQVAVACVRQIFEKDPTACRKWFLDKLTHPITTVSSESEVTSSIEGLHNCCGIPCSENWALPIKAVENVHSHIFKLHCEVNTSVYRLKSHVSDLVVMIIEQSNPINTYNSLLFDSIKISYVFGENGEIKTELTKKEKDWDLLSDNFLDRISASQNSNLKYKYFEAALHSISNDELSKKLIGAKVLSELAGDEKVQEAVSLNPNPIIEFVSHLLKSGEQDAEVTCMGLMVITAILDDPKYKNKRDWGAFKKLVDPLKEYQAKSSNVEVKVLAEELRSTILSRGVITAKRNENKYKEVKEESDITKAMKDAVDKLLPVRAHGLMSLAKLLAKNRPEATAKRDVLLCLFKENLKEEDSYVYLAAVEGLAALAASFPDDVIVTLTEQYRHTKVNEFKLKIGETLIKVVRLLNEMAVVYKAELIGAYLFSSQSDDYLVRASSLSNIGELCKILGFRVHAYITEIFKLLTNVVQTDKHPEPRRAAVLVLNLLLQGLGKDTFSTLQDLLLPMYRALKLISQTDKDDITRLHAELALRELNAVTTNFLMPPRTMEKRIYVLDHLPN